MPKKISAFVIPEMPLFSTNNVFFFFQANLVSLDPKRSQKIRVEIQDVRSLTSEYLFL